MPAVRKVSLTDDQLRRLFDLYNASAGKLWPEDEPLIKAGLAVDGRSRFGDYVKITEAGIALFKAMPIEEIVRLMRQQAERGSRAADTRAPGDTGESAVAPAPPPRRKRAAPDRSKRESASGTPSVEPNAVRVALNGKVTYYPLSSYESIRHGEKVRVRTTNKCYRTYALEASAGDAVVPA